MTEDMTPPHLRCVATFSCPSVHRLDDGRLLIVGEYATIADSSAYSKVLVSPGVGDHEIGIVVSPDLLSSYVQEEVKKAIEKIARRADVLACIKRLDAYYDAAGALEDFGEEIRSMSQHLTGDAPMPVEI